MLTPGPLLPSILQALTEVSLFQRDRLAQQLVARRGYLHKLLEIFRVCLVAGWQQRAACHMPHKQDQTDPWVGRWCLTLVAMWELQMCEDLEDEDSLHTLFTIFKQSEPLACVAPFARECLPCMR